MADFQLTQTGPQVQNILDQAPTHQELNQEKTERSDADMILQQNIDTEQSARENSDLQINGRINSIDNLIPEQASSENKLADKSFVNSSIGTNTAYYISNNGQPFGSLEELESYSGTLTNNDYAFVVGTDSAGNTTYTRYKYNAATQEWAAEYVLNNSSFTAEQWAAISSGITSGDVEKLSLLPTRSQLDSMLGSKQNVISDLSSIRSNATSGAAAWSKFQQGISVNDLNSNLRLLTESRMYVVNFGEFADTIVFTNLYGGIRITEFAGSNIEKIKVSYANVVEQEYNPETVAINIENGLNVTLKVVKTTDRQKAALSTRFAILTP